ncbi:TolA protein [Paramagnetospirillum magnetotacticum MS-1]|uniref:TolA protein n=1 Tax=Paramagnetospirillum magnetotacticum MS-1 TaxID=272627 RepID=A0A0C2YI34_PARME|nr:hypothetical protein [Paramagnetospirillum magnetotacticum]KIL99409.1 TolA protein [Paramagnetospirillum magnetotacticum MS-1]
MHSVMPDRRLMAALALSALLHVLVTLILQIESLSALIPERTERSMEVEVIPEPLKPEPPKPVAPPPPQEPPLPETPPEAPKVQTAPPPPPLPIQRPQLQPAPLAEKSKAPKSEPAKPALQSPGLSTDTGTFTRSAPAAGELSQNIQDKVLAQVVRMWHFNSAALRGSDIILSASLLVNRDGTLSGPMHKDAPWNPDAAIRGYSRLPEGTTKQMMETFLVALRMAQPLQLPPDDGKPWPRHMMLRFKPGDL